MSGIVKIAYFKSPYGELVLGTIDEKLCLCDWRFRAMREQVDRRIQSGLKAEYVEGRTETIEEAIVQLEAYFKEERKEFELPLLMVGSDFQKQVWRELLMVPFGKTETYSGLSQKLGDIKAIRAVASANGANALSIIVPCHRIIGSDGSLTGYAGGLEAKKKLLHLENAFMQGAKTLLNG